MSQQPMPFHQWKDGQIKKDTLANSGMRRMRERDWYHVAYGRYCDYVRTHQAVVDCGLCGTPTNMTGTKRCDRCWELEHRVRADPELARKILEEL